MRILQLNVARYGPRCEVAVDWAIDNCYDIIVLQEIPSIGELVDAAAGFRVVIPLGAFLSHVAIVVLDSSLCIKQMHDHDSPWFVEIAVKVNCSWFHVTSFYNRQDDGSRPLNNFLDRLPTVPKYWLVLMDANARHEDWDIVSNTNGHKIKKIFNDFDLKVMNKHGVITRSRVNNNEVQMSVIDLVVASMELVPFILDSTVLQDELDIASDHFSLSSVLFSHIQLRLTTKVLCLDKLINGIRGKQPYLDLSDLQISLQSMVLECSKEVQLVRRTSFWTPRLVLLKSIFISMKNLWLNSGKSDALKANYISHFVLVRHAVFYFNSFGRFGHFVFHFLPSSSPF